MSSTGVDPARFNLLERNSYLNCFLLPINEVEYNLLVSTTGCDWSDHLLASNLWYHLLTVNDAALIWLSVYHDDLLGRPSTSGGGTLYSNFLYNILLLSGVPRIAYHISLASCINTECGGSIIRFIHFTLGTRRCCDVESTALTLIQRRNNVVWQWVVCCIRPYFSAQCSVSRIMLLSISESLMLNSWPILTCYIVCPFSGEHIPLYAQTQSFDEFPIKTNQRNKLSYDQYLVHQKLDFCVTCYIFQHLI